MSYKGIHGTALMINAMIIVVLMVFMWVGGWILGTILFVLCVFAFTQLLTLAINMLSGENEETPSPVEVIVAGTEEQPVSAPLTPEQEKHDFKRPGT